LHEEDPVRCYEEPVGVFVGGKGFRKSTGGLDVVDELAIFRRWGRNARDCPKDINGAIRDMKEVAEVVVRSAISSLLERREPKLKWTYGFDTHTDPTMLLHAYRPITDTWIQVARGGTIDREVMRVCSRDPSECLGWSLCVRLDRLTAAI